MVSTPVVCPTCTTAGWSRIRSRKSRHALKHVAPFVVKIETSGGTEVVRTGGPRPGMVRRGTGPTTGVIVSADGYVISSSFNFANKPTTIRVALPAPIWSARPDVLSAPLPVARVIT